MLIEVNCEDNECEICSQKAFECQSVLVMLDDLFYCGHCLMGMGKSALKLFLATTAPVEEEHTEVFHLDGVSDETH